MGLGISDFTDIQQSETTCSLGRGSHHRILTVCLDAARTLLPNLARGVANGTDSASWGNLTQRTFSFVFLAPLRFCCCFPRFGRHSPVNFSCREPWMRWMNGPLMNPVLAESETDLTDIFQKFECRTNIRRVQVRPAERRLS